MKQVVVVTGGASGIGARLCQKYFLNHDIVYSIDLNKNKNEKIKSYCIDVLNYPLINNTLKQIYEENGQIDILINSAGYGIAGAVEDCDFLSLKHQHDVNFLACVNLSKEVIKYMQVGAKIINIGSVASFFPLPFQALYSASKAALLSFSEALSIELKPFGIHVSCMLPGDFTSNFTKARKVKILEDSRYEKLVKRSVHVMEKDELEGMSSLYVSDKIYKIVSKPKIKSRYTIGNKYKLFVFLKRVMPHSLVMRLLKKKYTS